MGAGGSHDDGFYGSHSMGWSQDDHQNHYHHSHKKHYYKYNTKQFFPEESSNKNHKVKLEVTVKPELQIQQHENKDHDENQDQKLTIFHLFGFDFDLDIDVDIDLVDDDDERKGFSEQEIQSIEIYSNQYDIPMLHEKCKKTAMLKTDCYIKCQGPCQSFSILDAGFDCSRNEVNKISNYCINKAMIKTQKEIVAVVQKSLQKSSLTKVQKLKFLKRVAKSIIYNKLQPE